MENLRLALEKYQGIIYLAFIVLGVVLGSLFPNFAKSLETSLVPTLAFLLYSTFCQVPLAHLPKAFSDYRFAIAILTGNFIIIPIFVAILLTFMNSFDAATKLGVALVLLVPCTDWFVTFSHLGKADTKYAIASIPTLLLLQFILLPLFIFLMFPEIIDVKIEKERFTKIFLGLIVFPLLLALLTQKLADHNPVGKNVINLVAWFPIPLLSIIVFTIFSTQVNVIVHLKGLLIFLTFIFSIFLVFALIVSKILSKITKLPNPIGRVLAFSFGTRNSFLVLPIAIALPEEFKITSIIIAYQILIELLGMLVFIKAVPQKFFPQHNN